MSEQSPYTTERGAGFEEVAQSGLSNRHANTQDRRRSDRTLDLASVVNYGWRQKWYLILPVIVGVLVGIALAAGVVGTTQSKVYSYPIQFSFDGVVDLKYPNGESFSIQSIITPNVLERVYRELDSNEGVLLQDFQQAFTISSYSPTRDFIIAAYSDRLSTRGLSLAESSELQEGLTADLARATRSAAIVSFDNSTVEMSKPSVVWALQRAVELWNENAIAVRGVLDLDLELLDPNVLSVGYFGSLNSVSQLGRLSNIHKTLETHLRRLLGYEGAGKLRDENNGSTISGLLVQLDVLEEQYFDLSRTLILKESTFSGRLPDLLSTAAFKNVNLDIFDPQIAFDVLLQRVDVVRGNIEKIANQTLGSTVIDPQTGLSIADLRNILKEIELYQIRSSRNRALISGKSRDPQAVEAYYKRRIRDLEQEKSGAQSLAGVIESVAARYEGAAASGVTPNSATTNTGTATIIPQLNDGFLDRILEMSSKGTDADFRQNLANRSIRLLDDVVNLEVQIARLRSDLALFNARPSSTPDITPEGEATEKAKFSALAKDLDKYMDVSVRIAQRIVVSRAAVDEFTQQMDLSDSKQAALLQAFYQRPANNAVSLDSILSSMKSTAEASNRLTEQLSATLYGSKALFSSIAEPEAQQPKLFALRTIALLTLATVLGLLFGLCWFLYRIVTIRQSRNI